MGKKRAPLCRGSIARNGVYQEFAVLGSKKAPYLSFASAAGVGSKDGSVSHILMRPGNEFLPQAAAHRKNSCCLSLGSAIIALRFHL